MSYPQFSAEKLAAFWAVRAPLVPSTDEEEETTVEEIIGRIREVEEKDGQPA